MTQSHLPRSLIALIAVTGALSGAVHASQAPSYVIVRPVPVRKPTPAPPKVALKETSLPRAVVGTNYTFDFKQVTTLTPATMDPGTVVYSLVGGQLPNMISLSSDGVLAGRMVRGYNPQGYDVLIRAEVGGSSSTRIYHMPAGSAF